MAKSSTKARRATEAFNTARSHPYVQRVIEDEELRGNLRDAIVSARGAYGRITKNGKPGKAITSKKVQRDLRSAAESLREASEQLRKPKKRKRRLGKLLLLGLIAAGVTLALSESARKAVMDALFGAEEEFEYTSTTSGSADGSGS